MFWGAKKFLKNFFKNILATALKSYIKWLLYIFFFSFSNNQFCGGFPNRKNYLTHIHINIISQVKNALLTTSPQYPV